MPNIQIWKRKWEVGNELPDRAPKCVLKPTVNCQVANRVSLCYGDETFKQENVIKFLFINIKLLEYFVANKSQIL